MLPLLDLAWGQKLQLAEPSHKYLNISDQKKEELIKNIQIALDSAPGTLSTEENWLRETLQIALKALKNLR